MAQWPRAVPSISEDLNRTVTNTIPRHLPHPQSVLHYNSHPLLMTRMSYQIDSNGPTPCYFFRWNSNPDHHHHHTSSGIPQKEDKKKHLFVHLLPGDFISYYTCNQIACKYTQLLSTIIIYNILASARATVSWRENIFDIKNSFAAGQ